MVLLFNKSFISCYSDNERVASQNICELESPGKLVFIKKILLLGRYYYNNFEKCIQIDVTIFKKKSRPEW